jgi:DNA-binding response OmpR family regulator
MRLRILIVEDRLEESVLSKIRLETLFPGVSVLQARNIISAQELILTSSLHVVILDHDLNAGTGVDLVPLIRKWNKDCIIAAASNSLLNNEKLIKAGADIIVATNNSQIFE